MFVETLPSPTTNRTYAYLLHDTPSIHQAHLPASFNVNSSIRKYPNRPLHCVVCNSYLYLKTVTKQMRKNKRDPPSVQTSWLESQVHESLRYLTHLGRVRVYLIAPRWKNISSIRSCNNPPRKNTFDISNNDEINWRKTIGKCKSAKYCLGVSHSPCKVWPGKKELEFEGHI